MTIEWERRHWYVSAVLLTLQVFGLWLSAARGAAVVRVVGVSGWIQLLGWIAGSAFLNAVILVKIYDSVRPDRR